MTEDKDKDIRSCFATYLEKVRVVDNEEEWMKEAEERLPAFIRTTADPSFPGLYVETSTSYYNNLLLQMGSNFVMRSADKRDGFYYSKALKMYVGFLQSKYFPRPDLPMETVETATPAERKAQLSEGAKRHIEAERNWRNPQLRKECIAYWGAQCQCCGMSFAQMYGEQLGRDYIEVHHLLPIATYDGTHTVDAARDLVPLCANCHAMIHHGEDGPLTLGKLRTHYKGTVCPIQKKKED